MNCISNICFSCMWLVDNKLLSFVAQLSKQKSSTKKLYAIVQNKSDLHICDLHIFEGIQNISVKILSKKLVCLYSPASDYFYHRPGVLLMYLCNYVGCIFSESYNCVYKLFEFFNVTNWCTLRTHITMIITLLVHL